jgi:hypothetical protein
MKEEKFSDNLPNKTNEQLCEIVVANRYIGTLRDEAIMSMEELARRRIAGDNFEYEKYIDKVLGELPKFDLDLKKIMDKFPRVF